MQSLVKSQVKKNFSNQEIEKSFLMKKSALDELFHGSSLNGNHFLEEIFKVAIEKELMQKDDTLYTGKANGLALLYSPSLSKKQYYKKGCTDFQIKMKPLILTEKNIEDVKFDNFNRVYLSTNLHYGKKNRIAYFTTIDIDFDDIIIYQDFSKMLAYLFNDKLLMPTIISNSGTGFHFFYRLAEPIKVTKKNADQINFFIKIIKNALHVTLLQSINENYEKATVLSANQKTRMVSTRIKISEFINYSTKESPFVCEAYKTGESITINKILEYIDPKVLKRVLYVNLNKKYKSSCEEDILNSLSEKIDFWDLYNEFFKIGEKLISNTQTIKTENKEYNMLNKNFYNGIKRKIIDEIEEGHRFFSMRALASAAVKCGVNYETLEKDAKQIMDFFNSKPNNSYFSIQDLENGISYYTNPYARYTKKKTIEQWCNFKFNTNKRNGKSQEEHLKKARKNIDTKKAEIMLGLKKILNKEGKVNFKKISQRSLGKILNCSHSTIGKYLKLFTVLFIKRDNFATKFLGVKDANEIILLEDKAFIIVLNELIRNYFLNKKGRKKRKRYLY